MHARSSQIIYAISPVWFGVDFSWKISKPIPNSWYDLISYILAYSYIIPRNSSKSVNRRQSPIYVTFSYGEYILQP